jgi:hypothetical protein
MSEWVKIRDSVLEALQLEDVGKELKGKFVGWLGDQGLDFAQAFVDKILDECKKDAPAESGWCKIRDMFVVPAALNIAMALLKIILEKAAKEEAAE